MIQDNIRKACKGSNDAMRMLYEGYKSKAMCLCLTLLADEKGADDAVAQVFRLVFDEVAAGRVSSSEDFENCW